MNAPIARGGVLLAFFWMMGSVAATRCVADTLYSDLGPGNTWIVNREYESDFDLMAAPFVTTGSGKLGDIVTPLFSLHNPVDLSLYTDSGDRPATLLESWSITVPSFPGILTTIPSVANPFLSADTQYWLVFPLTSLLKNNLAWYENNQGVTGGIWAGDNLNGLLNFVPASPAPAVQLNSLAPTSVPEPASAVTLAIVFALLMISRAASRVLSAIGLAAQPSSKPRLGEAQIVAHHVDRLAEGFRCLFRGHSAEIRHFDDPREGRVLLSQSVQSSVQVQQL
jgi:hypothetical protein